METNQTEPKSPPPEGQMGIKTAPDVWIDERDRWRFKDEVISNEEILQYFKTNLHRDDDGYFIENRWGEKRELGYLRGVFGFPLRAMSLEFLDGLTVEFLLDSGATSVSGLTELFYMDENTLAFVAPESGIPVRLSPQAMVKMSDRLLIDEQDVVWLQIPESKKITMMSKKRDEVFPGNSDMPAYQP